MAALAFLPGIFSIFYGDEAGLQGIHNLANRAPFPWGKEDEDLLSYFRNMLSIRESNEFLRTAECKIKDINNRYFAYERLSKHNTALIIASRSHYELEVDIPNEYQNAKVIFSVGGGTDLRKIAPYGVLILKRTV